MAETISDLLGGVCGMLLAGEIVYVVEGKKQARVFGIEILFDKSLFIFSL